MKRQVRLQDKRDRCLAARSVLIDLVFHITQRIGGLGARFCHRVDAPRLSLSWLEARERVLISALIQL